MIRTSSLIPTVLWTLGVCASVTAQAALEEVVTRHPNGGVRERYSVDEQNRKQGAFERLRADGTVELRATYRDDQPDGVEEKVARSGQVLERTGYRKGVLHGNHERFGTNGTRLLFESFRMGALTGRRETYWPGGGRRELTHWSSGVCHGAFEEVTEDGSRKRSGNYRRDHVHGTVKIKSGRKTLSKQTWADGHLVVLDGLKPFPRPKTEVQESLRAILTAPDHPPPATGDPLWPERQAALRRLMAYRALCGLPHQNLTLNPEWNALCDDASTVCKANGGISHHPPKPAGMNDALFRRGALGARKSNLSAGRADMAGTVDAYMDDSDRSNIAAIGHRRWCLNPSMGKTGFGRAGRFSAMWSMDSSGKGARGMDAVLYPPPGYVPTEYFGSRHAFSISPLRGSLPSKDKLDIRIRRLDPHFIPTEPALELDYLNVAKGGFGSGPCLIFRAKGFRVAPGHNYLVEVGSVEGSSRGQRKARPKALWRYVVAFVGSGS